jgi:hypothetical protein
MVSIGKWPTQIPGLCVGWDWYATSGPCLDRLRVEVLGSFGRVGLRIAGRNPYGPIGGVLTPSNCVATTDPYLQIAGSGAGLGVMFCDIWRAYRDGVWRSSTTIDVFAFGIGSGRTIRASIANKSTVFQDKTGIAFTINDCAGSALRATITVHDDGSFHLA